MRLDRERTSVANFLLPVLIGICTFILADGRSFAQNGAGSIRAGRDAVTQAVEALGGIDKWKSIHSIEIDATESDLNGAHSAYKIRIVSTWSQNAQRFTRSYGDNTANTAVSPQEVRPVTDLLPINSLAERTPAAALLMALSDPLSEIEETSKSESESCVSISEVILAIRKKVTLSKWCFSLSTHLPTLADVRVIDQHRFVVTGTRKIVYRNYHTVQGFQVPAQIEVSETPGRHYQDQINDWLPSTTVPSSLLTEAKQ
jgi:hypothetical protein